MSIKFVLDEYINDTCREMTVYKIENGRELEIFWKKVDKSVVIDQELKQLADALKEYYGEIDGAIQCRTIFTYHMDRWFRFRDLSYWLSGLGC